MVGHGLQGGRGGHRDHRGLLEAEPRACEPACPRGPRRTPRTCPSRRRTPRRPRRTSSPRRRRRRRCRRRRGRGPGSSGDGGRRRADPGRAVPSSGATCRGRAPRRAPAAAPRRRPGRRPRAGGSTRAAAPRRSRRCRARSRASGSAWFMAGSCSSFLIVALQGDRGSDRVAVLCTKTLSYKVRNSKSDANFEEQDDRAGERERQRRGRQWGSQRRRLTRSGCCAGPSWSPTRGGRSATIRSLAEELGVKPMSVYHYVANKDADPRRDRRHRVQRDRAPGHRR